jgi:hypothetical protein
VEPAHSRLVIPALIAWSGGQLALLARSLAYDLNGARAAPPACQPLLALRALERCGVATAMLSCGLGALRAGGNGTAGERGAAGAGAQAGQQVAVPRELLQDVEQALRSHRVIA